LVALALPEGFRGRIQPAEGAGPPSANAVASDGKRFVVLRATPALRALQGQSVSVARDGKRQGTAPSLARPRRQSLPTRPRGYPWRRTWQPAVPIGLGTVESPPRLL